MRFLSQGRVEERWATEEARDGPRKLHRAKRLQMWRYFFAFTQMARVMPSAERKLTRRRCQSCSAERHMFAEQRSSLSTMLRPVIRSEGEGLQRSTCAAIASLIVIWLTKRMSRRSILLAARAFFLLARMVWMMERNRSSRGGLRTNWRRQLRKGRRSVRQRGHASGRSSRKGSCFGVIWGLLGSCLVYVNN